MWRRSSVLMLFVGAFSSPEPSVAPSVDPGIVMSADGPDAAAVAGGEVV